MTQCSHSLFCFVLFSSVAFFFFPPSFSPLYHLMYITIGESTHLELLRCCSCLFFFPLFFFPFLVFASRLFYYYEPYLFSMRFFFPVSSSLLGQGVFRRFSYKVYRASFFLCVCGCAFSESRVMPLSFLFVYTFKHVCMCVCMSEWAWCAGGITSSRCLYSFLSFFLFSMICLVFFFHPEFIMHGQACRHDSQTT